MRTRREQLSPEVRARTILAACARACLTPMGDVASDVAACGHVGVLLDRSGGAYLVLSPGGRAPEGRFRISCRAGVPGLGVLRLEGSCGAPVCPAARPDVERLLSLHHAGWAASDALGGPDLTADDLTVVAVELAGVTVLTPATDTQRATAVPVDMAAYNAACPDGWLLDVESARELLEREHQEELRSLALLHAGASPAPLAVSVRTISPGHLDLACLSPDGVTSVMVPYGRHLDHPGDVRRWVTQAARRVA